LSVYGSFNDTDFNIDNLVWSNNKTIINFKHESGNWLSWGIIRSKQIFWGVGGTRSET